MSRSVSQESFQSLEEEWNRLLKTCPEATVFSTPHWQGAWWQEFGEGCELRLLAVREGDRLLGIAPLMRKDDLISFIGNVEVCDYMDFIVAPGQETLFYEALLDHLSASPWVTLDLRSLPDSSPTLSLFAPLAEGKGYLVKKEVEDVTPTVNLPPTWEEYLSLLSKKDRHELRRKMRRLSRQDAHYYITQNSSHLTQDMKDFFRLLKESGGEKARFMTSSKERFFRALSSSLAHRDALRLFFLEVNRVRVSTAMCFDYQGERSLYNSGYDPAYASLSVGFLLKAFCIKEAIAAGKKRFNLLRGAEPYKYDLGAQDSPLYRCLVQRNRGE